MNDKNRLLKIYLSYFYSICIGVGICILILNNLHIPQGSTEGFSDILPFWSVVPQQGKIIKYGISLNSIILGAWWSYFVIEKILNSKIGSFFISFLSFISTGILVSFYVLILQSGYTYIRSFSPVVEISPIILNPLFISILCVLLFSLCIIYFIKIPAIKSIFKINYIKKYQILLFILSIFLIFFTLFDRTFKETNLFIPILEQYSHTIPVIAPIYEVLHGKTLLVNADSQYGLLLVYLLAIPFKLFLPLTFEVFFYLMIFFGIMYVCIGILLLRKRLNNMIWAFSGLFCFFTFFFYSQTGRYTRPMVFPLRFLFDLPFFLLLLYVPPMQKGFIRFVYPLYITIAFFYNYETGISLAASYLACITIQSILSKGSIMNKISFVVSQISLLFVGVCSFVLLYSIFTKITTNTFPDWAFALFYVRIFSLGYNAGGEGPMLGLHLLPLFIYIIVITRLLVGIIHKRVSAQSSWDASLAVYGLATHIYYLKSPYIPNLPKISLPAVILFIILSKEMWDNRMHFESPKISLAKITFFAPFLVLSSMYVFSILFSIIRISINHRTEYWYPNAGSGPLYTYNDLRSSADLIQKYAKNDPQIVLIHYYDGFLLMKTNKVNALRLTNAQLIITYSQIQSLVNQMKNIQSRYIFTQSNHSIVLWTHILPQVFPKIYEYIYANYHNIDSSGDIIVWEKNT
jgi:hypothetical protein